jgi:chaperonin cofactor prefoldin
MYRQLSSGLYYKYLSISRKQLDSQLQETGRVQKELMSEGMQDYDENKPLDPDLAAIIGKPVDFMTQWKLEKELKEAKEETKTVRKRLKEVWRICCVILSISNILGDTGL